MKRIGIIGEGKMGSNIFYYLIDYNYHLTWICSNDADIEKIRNNFLKKIKRSAGAGIIDDKRLKDLEHTTVISQELPDLRGCDLVIEAAGESVALKKNIFMQVDNVVSESCILATNSSSIPPSELIPSPGRAEKTVGIHFFYPLILKNFAEVIFLPETAGIVKSKVLTFLEKIKKEVLVLDIENSFLLNRIFLEMQVEAFSVVSEGIADYGEVDAVVKESFNPSGVFEFCDHVGNDIMLTSVINYSRNAHDKARYLPFMLVLDELVKGGRLGIKTGVGFYRYGDENKTAVNVSQETRQKILSRISSGFDNAIDSFSKSTGLPDERLRYYMKEYLGDI